MIAIRKGGKYLTRSNHVVIIDHIDKSGHFSGSVMGVRIGAEAFDFRVNYANNKGLYYCAEITSVLDIVRDISDQKVPNRVYLSDMTMAIDDALRAE